MALYFYLNGQEIKVASNASFTATKDSTDDVGTLALAWNDSKDSIMPRTTLRIYDSSNAEEWNFIVLKDTVSRVRKTSPIKYLHTLTVIQNTHELTHFILRPSEFQQPTQFKKAKTIANGHILVTNDGGTTFTTDGIFRFPHTHTISPYAENQYRHDKVYIGEREKVDVATVDVESWLLAFNNSALGGGGTQLINSMGNPARGWLKNAHTQFKIKLCYYLNEGDITPTRSEEYTISNGSRLENAKCIQVDSDFFNANGWYGIELEFGNDAPKFSASSNELSYFRADAALNGQSLPTALATVDLTLNIKTYYYTLYDVLDLIRKQSLKTLGGVAREKALYYMPDEESIDPVESECATILKSVIAPEFKFNGGDVYEAVNQVFAYIDSVATMKSNGVLCFEYINDFNGEKLEMDQKISDIQQQLTDKMFDNQIITTYQNGKQATSITFPGENLFKKLENTNYGILDSIENYIITTDKPIENINRLCMYVGDVKYDYSYYIDYIYSPDQVALDKVKFSGLKMPNNVIDIAELTIERKLYSSLPINDPEDATLDLSQTNTIPFDMGSKSIAVGGTYEDPVFHYKYLQLTNLYWKALQLKYGYISDFSISKLSGGSYADYPSLYDQTYFIEYNATFDGQIMIESTENKKEGNFRVGQTASSVDINKMGSNMLGFIAKVGNESKVVTMKLTSYGSRMKKGSIWEDDNGNKWIANSVKTTFTVSSGLVINDVEFIKNFNELNKRTEINQEIRFYDIDSRLTTKGYENINEYIYFSSIRFIDTEFANQISDDFLEHIFRDTLTDNLPHMEANYAKIQFDSSSEFYVPLHTYGAGNVLCFEMDYDSPNLAGNTIYNTPNVQQKATLYPEYAETTTFQIVNCSSQHQPSNYPLANSYADEQVCIAASYKYYKRENEIFHLNYGIAFLPKGNEEIYIGSEFINQNGVIPNNKYKNVDRELHLYISKDENYGINDRKALGDDQGKCLIAINNTTKKIQVNADNVSEFTKGVSWCLADKDRNIYFAVNKSVQVVESQTPYWNCVLFYFKTGKRL